VRAGAPGESRRGRLVRAGARAKCERARAPSGKSGRALQVRAGAPSESGRARQVRAGARAKWEERARSPSESGGAE